MRGRFVVLAGCVVLGVLCAGTPAMAAGSDIYVGPPSGVAVKKGTNPPAPQAPSRALRAPGLAPLAAPAAPVTCPAAAPDPACNLTYHNGAVLHTNTTHIVYWEPAGYTVSANYHSLTERYLGDVAADSGRVTNPYATDTQYSDTTNGNILYSQTFAGALTDTAGYPAADSKCKLQGAATACLTQDQEVDELDAFIKSKSLPRGLNDIYFLVLPEKVQTCFGDFTDCGPYGGVTGADGKTSEYCAYHSSFNKGNGVTAWANMPDGADGNCNVISPAPNGDDADTLIDSLSHEHNETITNPNGGGWYDVNGSGENGDKCNDSFGPTLASTATGPYDVLINHHPYQIQWEWSNAITGCTMNYGAVAPTASFTSAPPSPHVNDTVSFDASASRSNDGGGYLIDYSWDFGDGGSGSGVSPTHAYGAPGTYKVTLTVKDDAGLTDATSHDVVVVKRPTTTTYNGPTSGDYNDPVTLSATLTDGGGSQGVSGQTLSFSLGAESCTATTDSHGNASCSVTPLDDPGSYTVTVSFGGDSIYSGSDASAPFTVRKEESKLSYTATNTSDYHDAFTASAKLVDPDGGAPIAGKSITFALGAGDTCTAKTDAAGVASCDITPTQAAGPYAIVASFGPDVDYVSSSVSTPFTITKEETKLSYDGPVRVANDFPTTLSATLQEDGTAPISGRTVKLTLGTGTTAQSCSATTDAAGHAKCTIASVQQPASATSVGVRADFAGDAYYLSSSDTATLKLVYYTGRAYALSQRVLAFGLPTTSDTGEISTSGRSNTTRTAALVSPFPLGPLVKASLLTASVTTGAGQSLAQASTSDLTVGVAGVPLIRATDIRSSSQSTCDVSSFSSSASGASTIGSLTIGGVLKTTASLGPNSVIHAGPATIVFNEQLPVPGASSGLQVNALHISVPGILDVVVASARSDVHNCP